MARPSRYHALADTLRQEIRSGRYPVGGLLPTELEICRREGVSRHTARDALRLLIEEGLVERRQGSGTRVIATERPAGFVQPLGGARELMQYARDARLVVKAMQQRPLTASEAARLEISPEGEWLVADGLRRRPSGEVLAATTLYVAPPYVGLRDELRGHEGAVQELVAASFGVQPAHIEQRICAEILDKPLASALQAEAGAAALRTLRRYYDERERLILASDSIHPADRFAYEMSYRREGA